MRLCSRCKTFLDPVGLFPCIHAPTGYLDVCLVCADARPDIITAETQLYDMQPHEEEAELTIVYRSYTAMQHRCRNHKRYQQTSVQFTYEEFLYWCQQNWAMYQDCLRTWAQSGKQWRLRPCIDRIDTQGDYALDNIQWTTIAHNSSKDCINSKLSREEVQAIRHMRAKGARIIDIAQQYGVAVGTISGIVNHRRRLSNTG